MVASWFKSARFGMFVHWGHSSQQGIELSWPLVGGIFALSEAKPVAVEQYHSSAATFDPHGFDATALAQLAKRCGMRYAVLTTKHHDGYAMFDTKVSAYSVMHSPCGRDIVREFVEAMRAEGIRVGLYFSLADWHHPDYPAFTSGRCPLQVPAWRAARPGALATLRGVHVCADAGAAHELRTDRPALVRRRLGADARRVADARISRDDPRTAAGHRDQRPPARFRRLRDAGAVRAGEAAGRAVGGLLDDE